MRSRLELTVDILDVCATDDEDMDARTAEGLDARPNAFGVGFAVWHCGTVPVEDQGFVGLVRERHSATKWRPGRGRHVPGRPLPA